MGWFDFMKRKPEAPFTPLDVQSTARGSYDRFEKKLLRSSVILLIMGKRGSGKTALGMTLLELIHHHTKRRCYVYGYEKTKLPLWVKKTTDIESLPQDTVLMIDEGAVTFSSREAMKDANKYLGKLMAIARHKNLTLLLATQNSAMIDLNVLRLADSLIFKEPSFLQTKFERKAIKDLYEKVTPAFAAKKKENLSPYCYIMDDDFEGMVRADLPTFWSQKVSTSQKKV